MRVTRECTSSGRRTVDCGLRAAHAHAHALLLLRRMPDGPACVMAKGTVPLSSNGVCRYDVRTYIHIHGIHNQVCVWASEHFTHIHTHTHTHAHTRRTPAPSLQVSLAPGFTSAASSIKQERARKRLTDMVIVR